MAANCRGKGTLPVIINCPNHHEILIGALWNCFQTKRRTDLEFKCGAQSVRAHRLVLEVFLLPEKLVESSAINSQEDSVNIGCLLEFLYKGTAAVPREQLDALLDIAKRLDFQLLVDAIESSPENPASNNSVTRKIEDGHGNSETDNNVGSLPKNAKKVQSRNTNSGKILIRPASVHLVDKNTGHELPPGRPVGLQHNGEVGNLASWHPLLESVKQLPKEVFVAMPSEEFERSYEEGPLRSVGSHNEDGGDGKPDVAGNNHELETPAGKEEVKEKKMFACSQCDYKAPKYANYRHHLALTHGVNTKGKQLAKCKLPKLGSKYKTIAPLHLDDQQVSNRETGNVGSESEATTSEAATSMPRRSYCASFKLKAIQFAELYGNRPAGRAFMIDESLVRVWRTQKEVLVRSPSTQRTRRSGRVAYPELEAQLYAWVMYQKSQGLPLPTLAVRNMAKTLASDMNLATFRGGSGWCSNFLRRHSLAVRLRTAADKFVLPVT